MSDAELKLWKGILEPKAKLPDKLFQDEDYEIHFRSRVFDSESRYIIERYQLLLQIGIPEISIPYLL